MIGLCDQRNKNMKVIMTQVPNPMMGPNRFKFGLFNANCDGGFTISKAPERWRASWDDIVKISLMADEAGVDFILPVAKWKGFGGDANVLGHSFETLTHSAAIGAITKRIGLFITVHAPLLTPAFAAKALATLDHVTHRRAGLNIVCGWNQDQFDVHGVTIDGDRRYEQGLEWFQILSKLLQGGPDFDWDGDFYKLRGLTTDPLCLQKPLPPIMSAASSADGRDFAAQSADMLFTNVPVLERAAEIVTRAQDHAARYGRRLEVFASSHIVCRPTRKEAEDFYHYFAETMADRSALANLLRNKAATASPDTKQHGPDPSLMKRERRGGPFHPGTFPGAYMFVGTPDDIVEEIVILERAGLRGAAITFLDYLADMPYFLAEVFPRLERLGLRMKVG